MGIYSKKLLKPENIDATAAETEPKKDGINKETVQKQLVLRQMDDSSNFSFDDFLKETIAWHKKTENQSKVKTIKFNFHSIEATQNTVDILTRKNKEVGSNRKKNKIYHKFLLLLSLSLPLSLFLLSNRSNSQFGWVRKFSKVQVP